MVPVQLAGEPVVPSKEGQSLFILVALIDNTQHAMRTHRTAVAAGKPASAVLDPKLGFRVTVGADAILDLVRYAFAIVALVRLHDGFKAGLRIFHFE